MKMENPRRLKTHKGWCQPEVRCKRHPKHRQSPGVCSFCLRERLAQLSTSYNNNTTSAASSSSSSSLSSSPYSSASSSNSSPVRYHRMASDVKGSTSMSFLIGGKNGLKKSRSVAFVPQDAAEGRKKSGFLSKLIRKTSQRTKDMFMHSRTMKEIEPTRVY